jgi:hypothetical protein
LQFRSTQHELPAIHQNTLSPSILSPCVPIASLLIHVFVFVCLFVVPGVLCHRHLALARLRGLTSLAMFDCTLQLLVMRHDASYHLAMPDGIGIIG